MSSSTSPRVSPQNFVVLTGNPNCGKTTLFNALTGLRAKVGNYAGVTVERKEGRLLAAPADLNVRVLDLPGTYSLSPQSLDEQISRDVLLNRLPELPAPALLVVVVDASNLQRNLYYATQVIELGYPTLIALNMMDVAERNGHLIDAKKLGAELGVSVVPIVASSGQGIPELRKEIVGLLSNRAQVKPRQFYEVPHQFKAEIDELALLLAKTFEERRSQACAEAVLILETKKHLLPAWNIIRRPSNKRYPQRANAWKQQRSIGARLLLKAVMLRWPASNAPSLSSSSIREKRLATVWIVF